MFQQKTVVLFASIFLCGSPVYVSASSSLPTSTRLFAAQALAPRSIGASWFGRLKNNLSDRLWVRYRRQPEPDNLPNRSRRAFLKKSLPATTLLASGNPVTAAPPVPVIDVTTHIYWQPMLAIAEAFRAHGIIIDVRREFEGAAAAAQNKNGFAYFENLVKRLLEPRGLAAERDAARVGATLGPEPWKKLLVTEFSYETGDHYEYEFPTTPAELARDVVRLASPDQWYRTYSGLVSRARLDAFLEQWPTIRDALSIDQRGANPFDQFFHHWDLSDGTWKKPIDQRMVRLLKRPQERLLSVLRAWNTSRQNSIRWAA